MSAANHRSYGSPGGATWRVLFGRALPSIVLLAAFDVSILLRSVLAARVYGGAFLLVVPGAVIMALTPLRARESAVRLAWSVGASMLLLMVLGLAYSLVLPHLGVARPLGEWSLAAGVDVVTVGATIANARQGDPLAYLLRSGRAPSARIIAVALLAVVPLAAWAGAERLNGGHSGSVALAVLVVIGLALFGLVVFAERAPRWLLGASLYALSAASLLMSSMRSNFPFGSDIQGEFHVFSVTLASGAWHLPANGNPYAAMLSITVLPAAIVSMTHLSGVMVFKMMYPLVFSLFPVLVLVISERWFPRRASLIGAIVVIAQGFYAASIDGLARQEIGLLYFGLLAATAFDDALPRRARQVGVAVCACAMSISHYSTAYFAVTVLILGYVAFGLQRLVRLRTRTAAVISLPVILASVASVLLWNVTITKSAQNVGNFASSIGSSGLQILPGNRGTSVLTRFINADVSPPVTPAQFVVKATRFYAHNDPWITTYPKALTERYPVTGAGVPIVRQPLSSTIGNIASKLETTGNELLLVLIAVGVLCLIWRERRIATPERSELAAVALGTLLFLGLLRTSGTVSTFYNAPRGQVQGAVVLSTGLALVMSWLFSRRVIIRGALVSLSGLGVAYLLFAYSGLVPYLVDGAGIDTLTNAGEAYQRFYFTDADMASVSWLVGVHRPGDVVYADTYGTLQLDERSEFSGLIETLIPPVIDRSAYVYATSTNVVDGTARSAVASSDLLYEFPTAFLDRVKNVVFSTATTKVYR